VFNIDPNLSSLTFSLKTTTNVTFTAPQFAGADMASISGTMLVDVVPGTSVKFLSTADQQFALQPVPVAPGPGGVFPGSAPGQYGLLALIPGVVGGPGPGGTGLIADRNLVADSTSGIIPLVAGSYDSTQVTQNLTSGIAEFNLLVLGNPVVSILSLSSSPAANLLSGGTLVETPFLDTLTLPFLTNAQISGNGVVVIAQFSGELVATAKVPEPSTIVLGCLALIGLAAWRPWRKR
jgi:hypothetical protein